jgi:excisionase family DNA binding protein
MRKRMKTYKKTFDLRLGKLNMTYTVEEISELLGVTKGTVYHWIKKGLTPIDNQIPYLFFGMKLKKFLNDRQKKRKWECNIYELPCFKCQRPRRALKGKARIQFSKKSRVNITANCVLCQSKMFKCISMKQLPEVLKHLCIEVLQQPHIVESGNSTCTVRINVVTKTSHISEEDNGQIGKQLGVLEKGAERGDSK